MHLNLLFAVSSIILTGIATTPTRDTLVHAAKGNGNANSTVVVLGEFTRNTTLYKGAIGKNIPAVIEIYNNTFDKPSKQNVAVNMTLTGNPNNVSVIELIFDKKNMSTVKFSPQRTGLPRKKLSLSNIASGDPIVGNATVVAPKLGLQGNYTTLFLMEIAENKTDSATGFGFIFDMDNGQAS